MAKIDYWGIREGIKATLEADADLDGLTIQIEKEFLYSKEMVPAVIIYLDNREAPEEEQRIKAGRSTDFFLNFSLVCFESSLEGLDTSIKLRDDLIGKIELALMRDRSLNNTVIAHWLTGGNMVSAETEEGDFLAAAEILITAHQQASL